MYENKADKNFSFKIFMNKKPILIGQKFPSRSSCIQNIKKTLSTLQSNNMISIRSAGTGKYAFSIGKAESVVFKSLELASDGLAYLKETVGMADSFEVSFDTQKEKIAAKKIMAHKKPRFNITQTSKTKKAGFELIDKSKSNLFYFHFNDAKGKPFLYSRAYDGKTRRTKAAKKLIKGIKEKYQIITDFVIEKEGVFAVLKERDGLEIARSRIYKNRIKLNKALTYFKKETKGSFKTLKVAKKKKKKKKARKLTKEKYLLKQKAPIGEVGFEGFKNAKNKLHFFHYYDSKGETLLFSPSFTTRKKRDKAIQTAIQLSKNKRLYSMKTKGAKHYFVLVTAEGKGVARSRFFSTEADMIKGMRHLHTNARTYDERNNVVTIPTTETIIIKLDEKNKVASKLTDKEKNIPEQSKVLKPVVVPKSSKTNGIFETNNKQQIIKKPKNGRLPSNKRSTPSTKKEPIKSQPNKPKATPIDENKKPLITQPNTLKSPPSKRTTPKKPLPPLTEVEKTARSSTRTRQNRRPPIQKETRKQVPLKNKVDIEENEPPRIQPRSEEQSGINWWWLPVILLAALLLYGLFKLLSGFMLI